MALSDQNDGAASELIDGIGSLRYLDTSEPFTGDYRVVFDDPVRYYSIADGRELVPLYATYQSQANYTGKLANFTLDIQEVKRWLKVQHDLETDFIQALTDAAIDQAGGYLNRDWPAGSYPAGIKVDILNMIAYRFENRGDISGGMPPIPLPALNQYRLLPGL